MIRIIMTLDYELHGNGTGDVLKNIINPTKEILDLCDKYNAKLTIMFEIAEYWAFKKAEKEGKLENLGYSPSGILENQARDAIIRGHDVQLHLHPQWIGSELKNGNWKLNLNYQNLSCLPHGLGHNKDIYSINGALHQGKNGLEKILKKVDKNYKCIAFRAGGWSIQPEKDIIFSMKKNGIKTDTSVFKGGFEAVNGIGYDFRKAEKNFGYWWTKDNDVNSAGETGKNIIEMPIYSKIKSSLNYFRLTNLLTTLKRELNRDKNPYGEEIKTLLNNKMNLLNILLLNILFKNAPIKWDFCKQSHRELIDFLSSAIEKSQYEKKNLIPLVMIGHSKDFFNKKNFEIFLRKTNNYFNNDDVSFSTISSATTEIESESK